MAVNVHYVGELILSDMRGLFPLQKQPPIAVSDFLFAVDGIYRRGAVDICHDSTHECSYASKGNIDHNQRISQAGLTINDNDQHLNTDLPNFFWPHFTVGGTTSIQMFADNGPTRFQRIDVICTDPTDTQNSTVDALADNVVLQGVRLHITRSLFTKLNSATECFYEIIITIGDHLLPSSPVSYYCVRVSNRRSPEILYSGDGTNWQVLRGGARAVNNPAASRSTTPAYQDSAGMFEATVMGNKVSLNLGGMAQPYVTDLVVNTTSDANGNLYQTIQTPVITSVRFRAQNFTHIGLAAHPTCFLAAASMRSNPQPLGFAPDQSTPIYFILYTADNARQVQSGQVWQPGFPGLSTVTVTQVTAGQPLLTAPQYDLAIANPTDFTAYGVSYSYQTACITRVVTKCDGLVEYAAPLYSTILLQDGPRPGFTGDPSAPPPPPGLRLIREVQTFDPDALTIKHELTITLSNWLGPDYLLASTGIAGSGNFGVILDLGHRTDPTGSVSRRFVGYCDTLDFDHPSPGTATVTLTCCDQMQQMADVQIAAPPNMDGYYHFYAMQYLIQRSGITRDQIKFYSINPVTAEIVLINVPDDPFLADPNDPDPYFLPVGAGGNPWTPVNRTMSCLQIADQIRKVSGFLQYVDNFGYMTYAPWIHPEWRGIKRTFTERPTDAFGVPGAGLTEIQSIRTRISTRDTRNVVTTIGLDPFRDGMPTIVTKIEDSASIDAPAGSQPYNYVSYPKIFVWVDSRFANPTFAASAARRLWNFMRQPEVSSSIVVWPQYDIFALDVVQIEDSRCRASGLPMVVMQTDLTLAIEGEKLVQEERIDARYLVTVDPGAIP